MCKSYSQKLSREKTFANFEVLWLFGGHGVFWKFLEAWAPLAWQKQAICESFLREYRIFHQFAEVFSLESFPLTVLANTQ